MCKQKFANNWKMAGNIAESSKFKPQALLLGVGNFKKIWGGQLKYSLDNLTYAIIFRNHNFKIYGSSKNLTEKSATTSLDPQVSYTRTSPSTCDVPPRKGDVVIHNGQFTQLSRVIHVLSMEKERPQYGGGVVQPQRGT